MTAAARLAPAAPALSRAKRAFDILASAFALLLLAPLLLLVAAAVILDSGWPPLFLQDRIGLAGRRFRIFKFRTMRHNAERIGAGLWLESNDPRFTRIGPFLRKTSLDELPQLWNVLRGDMSVVGPRPLHPSTVARLDLDQQGRHRARPGLTGWAVLHGRNSIPYSRRFALDNWYIDHWSFTLDLRIALATVPVALSARHMKMDQTAADIDDLATPATPSAGPGIA